MRCSPTTVSTVLAVSLLAPAGLALAQKADRIYSNGHVVTVDRDFSVQEAFAVSGERLVGVGSNEEMQALRGPDTEVVDLKGRTVLPGLIDSHTHPSGASLTEFDHPIPPMETVQDVLDYIRGRAEALGPGEWVVVRQVFITRLKEQRYPSRAELDEVAPKNPVLFSTGPDASLNSLALKISDIDKNFKPEGPGKVERDPESGEPTGILRNLTRYVKAKSTGRDPSESEQVQRLLDLMDDYAASGLTSVIDRNASPSTVERYGRMLEAGKLPVRVGISRSVGSSGPLDEIIKEIQEVARHPLHEGSPRLRIIGIKMFLDGGMLTGSAYMQKPWGKSRIYSIDDPEYRGVLFIPPERLGPIVEATVKAGLQFTAHSVGDGAVQTLLDAYEAVNKKTPIASTRPCITHSNFMTQESIDQAARLGVLVDMQPAWLYLDSRTLLKQFGPERIREFQPLKRLFKAGVTVGGGSDHMQKLGSLRSVNPYNPFLGMWVAITRKAKGVEKPVNPGEALTREQAIRLYTVNNARLLFLEDEVGSLEKGKRADFVILDRDILNCPVEEIREIQAIATYVDGKPVFERGESK